MAAPEPSPESLIPLFRTTKLLKQDDGGRRTVLLGQINDSPALLLLERQPFPTSIPYLSALPTTLSSLHSLGANDVFYWYLAHNSHAASDSNPDFADLKLVLIYPCNDSQIKKYTPQKARVVVETPDIYREKVRPYMAAKREEGKLNWVFNIIDGKSEVDQVLYRTALGQTGDEGFLLIPDYNWDRKTLEAMHLLGIVERRDIWSLRDLKKKHVQWLKHMRRKLVDSTVKMYESEGLEEDQLKLYVHYQPTYYHFHIHIVHVSLEGSPTQAIGKAIGLDAIISQLEGMEGDEGKGMDSVDLSYTVGEKQEIWTEIFEPLKIEKRRLSQSQ